VLRSVATKEAQTFAPAKRYKPKRSRVLTVANRRSKGLLASGQLVGQLKALDKGATLGPTRMGEDVSVGPSCRVARLLDSLGLPYSLDSLSLGFEAEGGLPRRRAHGDIRGEEALPPGEKGGEELSCEAVLIEMSSSRSDLLDPGLRVVNISEDNDGNAALEGRLQTIFLDDPSFNFDYAHILPKTEKCSVMHGHTSSALVEIVGHPWTGWSSTSTTRSP